MTEETVVEYQTRPMWKRAKFVLPMTGMILVTALTLLALGLIVAYPKSAAAISSMLATVSLSIGGMAATGSAGIAAYDTFQARKNGGDDRR